MEVVCISMTLVRKYVEVDKGSDGIPNSVVQSKRIFLL